MLLVVRADDALGAGTEDLELQAARTIPDHEWRPFPRRIALPGNAASTARSSSMAVGSRPSNVSSFGGQPRRRAPPLPGQPPEGRRTRADSPLHNTVRPTAQESLNFARKGSPRGEAGGTQLRPGGADCKRAAKVAREPDVSISLAPPVSREPAGHFPLGRGFSPRFFPCLHTTCECQRRIGLAGVARPRRLACSTSRRPEREAALGRWRRSAPWSRREVEDGLASRLFTALHERRTRFGPRACGSLEPVS